MPVTLRHTLPGCSFALWRIDEDTARLASLCTGQENAWAGTLAPERRRREWLAWHAALHEEAPAEETFYRPSGAPALRSGRHIAVSHAGRIRRADALRRSVRTRHRTGGPRLHEDGGKVSRSGRAEVAGIRGGLSAGIVWCAKEALYKWSGLGGLDWLRDIRVTKIDPVRETLEGTAGGKRIGLKVIPHPELHIVFCAG